MALSRSSILGSMTYANFPDTRPPRGLARVRGECMDSDTQSYGMFVKCNVLEKVHSK